MHFRLRQRHRRYLTFSGRLTLAATGLAAAFVLLLSFWPSNHVGHPDTIEAHPAPPPDLARIGDLKVIEKRLTEMEREENRRLKRLETMVIDRETAQREALSNIAEAKVRLRTMEDQLGMIRITADDTREGVNEIRDILKEHIVKGSRPFDQDRIDPAGQVPPRPFPEGTVH